MAWHPQTYLKFGDYRTRPAADLLAHVPLDRPGLVYDLGCGPGNSTSLLCQRWPDARVVGVDSSAEMIAAARDSRTPAEWQLARIEDWKPEEPPDVIFTNAALQWVGDHHRLMPRLMREVAPGGVLAAQIPHRMPGQAFVTELHEVARSGPWSGLFAKLPWGEPGPSPEDYYGFLCSDAAQIDIWTTEYLHVLVGDDPVLEWTRGTALLPFLEKLDEAEKTAFTNEYRQRLRRAYPRTASGVTLFPFVRLFVVAKH
jgi:trans-aconitate 2-methyltransferase